MAEPRILRVKYVRAADPIGRLVIGAAAATWSDDVPDWRDNEYIRGQVEAILEIVRVIPEPFDQNWFDLEDQHDIAQALIRAALDQRLDDELKKWRLL